MIALCRVAVAVEAVRVAVFTTRNDNDDNGNGSKNGLEGDSISVSPTTAPPTAAPTVNPDVIVALDAILRTVPTNNTDTFNNDADDSQSSSSSPSSSPQSRARTWMLETDELRDSLLLMSNTEPASYTHLTLPTTYIL